MPPQVQELWEKQPDYLIFCGGAVVLFLLFQLVVWRGKVRKRISFFAWLLLAGILSAGWWMVDWAGQREQTRMQGMMEGFAPTYALEMQRMGHARISDDTARDDPEYIDMIEAEKRWLKANPMINDIYTIGHRADGKLGLMVDSETDYNRDGAYDGESEERTLIGEEYEDDLEKIEQVFATDRPVFAPEPTSDRWGTWVSAYAPILDDKGRTIAVLGVDLDASNWKEAVTRARLMALSWLGMLVLIVAGLSTGAGLILIRHDHDREKEAQRILNEGQAKFESLVHSIDGIVWEWRPASGAFSFMSQQAQTMLGGRPEDCLSGQFWEGRIAPDHREMVARKRQEAADSGRPYCIEYRFAAGGGRLRWLRENGNPVRGISGKVEMLRGVLTDVTDAKAASEEREAMQKQLVEASRHAGMAEVATGVLHNVGNVLNSVNVSSEVIQDRIRQSKSSWLAKLAELLREQGPNLPQFLTSDARGRLVPDYLDQLSGQIAADQEALKQEVENLVRNVEHIKDVVVMQQAYAKLSGRTEAVAPQELLEDALRLNAASFTRHRIEVVRNFQKVPKITVDRHRVLQILINLLRNAKHALDDARRDEKKLTLGLSAADNGWLRITVQDNGVGIAPENLTRIFSHGFTTKRNGHGFGLHISAVTAQEMGGCLRAHSDGPGKGAIFCLDLPLEPRHAPGAAARPPARPAQQPAAAPTTQNPTPLPHNNSPAARMKESSHSPSLANV